MSTRWKRCLLISLAVILVIIGIILGVYPDLLNQRLPLISPRLPGGVPSPNLAIIDCTHDPASVPPPPRGPDGQPANFLHTCGSQIYDSHGQEVKFTGVNWSGMEGSGYAPGGLNNRNYQDILDQIAALGYNTVRIPFSNEAIDSGQQIGNVNFGLNPDLQGLSGLGMLDHLVAAARARGMKVILDCHQPTSAGPTELWYNDQVPQDRWIADWQMLARHYYGNDTVIAFDLHNEPHGPATWGTGDPNTDWRLAAEKAGNAVLDVNPYLLIFVEGIGDYQGDHFWWGGNLLGVRAAPVRLHVPNRLVYSPHDYGPAISSQTWFSDPNFPNDLPGVWDHHWGYIPETGIAPVVVGEFGGWSFGNDADGKWQRTLLTYLKTHDIGFLVWSLNPSWDTGGVLQGDWQTVDSVKQQAYQPLLAPPLATGPTGVFGKAPIQLKVLFHQDASNGQPSNVTFAFRIFDDGATPLDLSRLELRYWLDRGTNILPGHVSVDSGQLGGVPLQGDVVPSSRGTYLRIRFPPGAGTVGRYQATGAVTVRFQKPVTLGAVTSADYSFDPTPLPPDQYQSWDHVTLYLDGTLVWGREPG